MCSARYHRHHRLLAIAGVALLLGAACSDNGTKSISDASITPDTASNPNAPTPPSGLTITAATKSSIRMTWTASTSTTVTAYTVERSPAGAASFNAIATDLAATSTSFEDTTVDQYTAYTYRARAANAGGTSAPSNEDTAGPPPARLQTAASPPTDQGAVYQYGTNASLALDENDDPLIAYVGSYSTSGSGDTDRLYFVRWDRTSYQWQVPRHLEDLGDITPNEPNLAASLARDASNNRLAVAYATGNQQIWLAISEDGGASWSKERIDLRDEAFDDPISNPRVALAGGMIHVAYYHGCLKAHAGSFICNSAQDSNTIVYLSRTGAAGTFSSMMPPTLPETQDAVPWGDLALDSSGNPGIAYYQRWPFGGSTNYNLTLAFWRPGQAAVKVTDSKETQNDTPSLSLAFNGTRPYLAYHLQRSSGQAHDLWFSSASDGGTTWNPPVAIPRDSTSSTSLYGALAVDAAGNAVVAAYFSHGSGADLLGAPKLFRASATDLSTWTVSSPDKTVLSEFAGQYLDDAFAGNSKLSLVFSYAGTNANLAPGLIFWREP